MCLVSILSITGEASERREVNAGENRLTSSGKQGKTTKQAASEITTN